MYASISLFLQPAVATSMTSSAMNGTEPGERQHSTADAVATPIPIIQQFRLQENFSSAVIIAFRFEYICAHCKESRC
jgi:hypothetical protein